MGLGIAREETLAATAKSETERMLDQHCATRCIISSMYNIASSLTQR